MSTNWANIQNKKPFSYVHKKTGKSLIKEMGEWVLHINQGVKEWVYVIFYSNSNNDEINGLNLVDQEYRIEGFAEDFNNFDRTEGPIINNDLDFLENSVFVIRGNKFSVADSEIDSNGWLVVDISGGCDKYDDWDLELGKVIKTGCEC